MVWDITIVSTDEGIAILVLQLPIDVLLEKCNDAHGSATLMQPAACASRDELMAYDGAFKQVFETKRVLL